MNEVVIKSETGWTVNELQKWSEYTGVLRVDGRILKGQKFRQAVLYFATEELAHEFTKAAAGALGGTGYLVS